MESVYPSNVPFIIAEMSGNHNQSLDRALDIVRAAAKTGVNALKLQTYTADTITMKGALTIQDDQSLWKGKELYQLYQEAFTPWEWHKPIFDLANELGMIAFSSPFDETAVDFLESLNVPMYKIASFENTHHPLLRKVAATGKPIIMSTGVASLLEIEESVEVLRQAGCEDLTLLKCTSTYPATAENTNLVTIPFLKNRFGCTVGLSDHTMGIGVSVAAVGLGARVIEKHFTLRRADGGVDSAFSMEPHEMEQLVRECHQAQLALGHVQLEVQTNEEKNRLFKRSIYIAKPIAAGETFTSDNIRIIRPALGLAPKFWIDVIGKQATQALEPGQPLLQEHVQWELVINSQF
jgi:pseudaminic acid synthase